MQCVRWLLNHLNFFVQSQPYYLRALEGGSSSTSVPLLPKIPLKIVKNLKQIAPATTVFFQKAFEISMVHVTSHHYRINVK